jgi:ABC-type multidrug transport system ATPase subunit
MHDFLVERAPVGDAVVRSRLIAAGFPYRDHGKAMNVLSGGERARVLFVLLALEQPNFLVLDEPTNHIDMQGRRELETDLVASGTAVLITSHDRRFLDAIADRFLLIRDGVLIEVTDPAPYYDAPQAPQAVIVAPAHARAAGTSGESDPLTRIVELEALLAADLARKPKFQKPMQQQAWRDELASLYRRLE